MRSLLHSYIGDYYLTDFLGAGGMGEVYRAVHEKIDRVAAIKILTGFDSDAKCSQRFINEARIQAGLHHPNIATLYDFVEFEGRPCIIMEYVDGQTLYDRIQSQGGLPLPEVKSIFRAVVEAIAYIHEQGILHRDIKSNNIKISSAGGVKLLDFGIAKDTVTPRLTLDGHYVGTLYYLSPEQLMGEKVDARCDIWSLGILLYEMVSGRLPFETHSISELYRKITLADYVPASAVVPLVAGEMENIIKRCLQPKPDDRFDSARQLLNEVCQTSPLATSSPSDILQKISRHGMIFSSIKANWLLITAGFLLFSVLTAGFYFLDSDLDKPSDLLLQPRPSHNGVPPPPLSATGSTPIKVDTYDGRADVYEHGKYVGQTPYLQHYPIGEKVEIILKRNGYQDKVIQFEVGEIANQYSYGLNKKNNP